jgi:hypothetical protein
LRFQVPTALQVTRVLTAKRSNTYKHDMDKINITPNIRINYVIIIYKVIGTRNTKFGATVVKLGISEVI